MTRFPRADGTKFPTRPLLMVGLWKRRSHYAQQQFLNYSAYTLEVSDADDPKRNELAADSELRAARLLVRSTGFGPKGATKRMGTMIQRVDLNLTSARCS